MSEHPTTTCNVTLHHGSFRESLERHVTDEADQTERATTPSFNTPSVKRHVSALRTLAHYFSGLGREDQRLCALSQIAAAMGGHRDKFEPTKLQGQLLARLGGTFEPPSADATLTELVNLGVHDLAARQNAQDVEVRAAGQRVEAHAAELEEAAQRVSAAEGELMSLRDEIVSLREENKEIEEDKATLQKLLAPAEKAPPPPRRVNLGKQTGDEAHTGIYFKDRDEERIYEVYYRENGEAKWRTVGPDLDEAIALRAKLTGNPNEKEAVAA